MVGRIRSDSKKQKKRDNNVDDGDKQIKKLKSPHHLDQQLDKLSNGEHGSKTLSDTDVEEGLSDDAKPIGEISRVSDHGGEKKTHFKAFEFDGRRFGIEDSVLVTPEEGKIKPAVVIIKDIFQTQDGSLTVNAQRLYRPEEAEKREGGTWQSHDNRELFYSCNLDQVPADSVMHKCVIHFVPPSKPPPDRKVHPGFVVKKAYDFVQRRLRDLTDRDCKGLLQQKAMS